jgi:hypothetical protein
MDLGRRERVPKFILFHSAKRQVIVRILDVVKRAVAGYQLTIEIFEKEHLGVRVVFPIDRLPCRL